MTRKPRSSWWAPTAGAGGGGEVIPFGRVGNSVLLPGAVLAQKAGWEGPVLGARET